MFFKLIRELFFLILVLYLITSLITNWHRYSSCFAPTHTFLLTVYIFILLSRLIRIFIKGTLFLHKFFYPVLTLIAIQGIIYQILNNIYSPTCGTEPGHIALGGQVWAALMLLLLANMGPVMMMLGNCVLSVMYSIFESRMESVFQEVNSIIANREILLAGGMGYKDYKGLSSEEMGKIKELMKNEVREDRFEQETCSVCYEDLAKGEEMCVLPKCNHMFHMNCVKQWLAKCPVCPMCRSNVRANLGVESLKDEKVMSQV